MESDPPTGSFSVLTHVQTLWYVMRKQQQGVTMTDETTPRPWYACTWDPMETPHISTVDGPHHPNLDIAQRLTKANAELIVEAVNHYDRVRSIGSTNVDDALDGVMRNVTIGTWYDDPANDRGGAAVARLHDAEAAMWRLYDALGRDPGDAYTRRSLGGGRTDATAR